MINEMRSTVRLTRLAWFAVSESGAEVEGNGERLTFEAADPRNQWTQTLNSLAMTSTENRGLLDFLCEAGMAVRLSFGGVDGVAIDDQVGNQSRERRQALDDVAPVGAGHRAWVTPVDSAILVSSCSPCDNCLRLWRASSAGRLEGPQDSPASLSLLSATVRALAASVSEGQRSACWLVHIGHEAFGVIDYEPHPRCGACGPVFQESQLVNPLCGPVFWTTRRDPGLGAGPPAVTAHAFARLANGRTRRVAGIGSGATEAARRVTACAEAFERKTFFEARGGCNPVPPLTWDLVRGIMVDRKPVCADVQAGPGGGTTAGWAAHPDRAGAIVRGLLEVIEREAVRRAWASPRPLQPLHLAGHPLASTRLGEAGMRLRHWILPAIGSVPSVLTVAIAEQHRWLGRGAFVMSAASGLSMSAARNAADLGALQSVEQLALCPTGTSLRDVPPETRLHLPYLAEGSDAVLSQFDGGGAAIKTGDCRSTNPSEEDALNYVLEAVSEVNLRPRWVDFTRLGDEFDGLFVGRVYVPGVSL